MIFRAKIRFVLLLFSVLCAGNALAQEEQTPENLLDEPLEEVVEETPVEEPVETPPSEVVDVNEDNFRRSMELRDRNLQRSPDLTTGSYSTSTAQQALENLPEESQKHLREQLREVIVENGPWTPEEYGTEYPYAPSEQAEKNGSLRNREQLAWGEMVSEYHEREAAIHGNAARTQAATAAAGQPGQNEAGETGESPTMQGAGTEGQSGEASEDAAKAERSQALAEMLNSSQSTNSGSASQDTPQVENGTEQNALELLTERNQVPAQPASATAEIVSASIEISESASQLQAADTGEVPQDPAPGISNDDVIAIEDLEKVIADPRAGDEN